MSFDAGQPNSVFDALRPREAQTLSRAAAATYSLDLTALLGLVLVLGGDGGAEFNASPLGLADAFRKIAGRLTVLHQAGRLNAPGAHRTVLPLLDTMLKPIHADETEGSWHPKVVLARYESRTGPEWRFWIGSRNLTGTADLDAGLLLVSGSGPGLKRIPGLADLAAGLLQEAGWSPGELEELKAARWACPPGTSVRAVVWRRPGVRSDFLSSQPLKRPDKVWAVAPFINRTGLAAILQAVRTPVTLLTTRRAGTDCAPVEAVAFRVWSAPSPHAPVDLEAEQTPPDAEFADHPPAGIHAKLLMTGKGAARALLIGSANLTSRGLLGPNAEAGVWLDIADPALAGSLEAFVASGMELIPETPDPALRERERRMRDLDAVVSRFLQLPLKLVSGPEGLFLSANGPSEALADAAFCAAPFQHPAMLTPWKAGAVRVRLLETPPPTSSQTDLVVLQAQSLEDPSVRRTWTQKAEFAGFDPDRRDDALLAAYIGPARFRAWLKSRLEGIDASGSERWNDPAPGHGWAGAALAGEFFTLEAMLGKWAADPEAFEARLPEILTMLRSFRETFSGIADLAERARALEDLDEVAPFVEAVAGAVRAGSQ